MIVLHGVEKFVAAVDLKVEQMRRATAAATAKALHLIERNAKLKLGEKSHQRGTPTPSAPGEPPALVSGNLRRSITVEGPDAISRNTWKGQVGPTAAYGRAQELGNPTGRPPLPARPYMTPAYDVSKEEIRAIFEAAWSEAILK